MSGTDAAVEALGDVIAAYKKRIVDLETIVAQQQEALARQASPPKDDPPVDEP